MDAALPRRIGESAPNRGSRPDSTDPIASALDAADYAERPAERYLLAHAAALRIAAEVLAGRPRTRGVLRTIDGSPRNVWAVLGDLAPELAEWAGYFAALEPKRRTVAAGATAIVAEREADDLVRDARAFGAAADLAWAQGWRVQATQQNAAARARTITGSAS